MHRVMHRNPRYSASADCCRHCTEGAQAHHCGSPPCKCNDQSEVPFSIGSMEQNEATAPNSIVVGTIAPWAAAMMFPDPEPPVSCPKTLWTGAGHGHLGLTEWATSRLHLRAAGSRYTEGRCLFTEGQRGGALSLSRGTRDGKPIARSAPGSSPWMFTPGAVLLADCRASLLGFVGGHAPTVPTAGTARLNTHSDSTGLRHIGDRFERFGYHLVPELPEPSWRPIGRNRNTLGTAVEHLGPTTPELTPWPPEQSSLSPTSTSRFGRSILIQYRWKLVDGAGF
jgi:hypothetical protein